VAGVCCCYQPLHQLPMRRPAFCSQLPRCRLRWPTFRIWRRMMDSRWPPSCSRSVGRQKLAPNNVWIFICQLFVFSKYWISLLITASGQYFGHSPVTWLVLDVLWSGCVDELTQIQVGYLWDLSRAVVHWCGPTLESRLVVDGVMMKDRWLVVVPVNPVCQAGPSASLQDPPL